MSLAQKVWFITGTSSGLGRHLVHAALARNDKVIATARKLEAIRDLQSDNCSIMQLDVRGDFAALKEKAARAVSVFGRVDVLVNNAGLGVMGMFEEAGSEAFAKQMQTNFFGPINVTNAFLPHMRERRDGTIVFIGSRSSYRANVPMIGLYASSKAALTAATEALSVEVKPFNVRVLTVLPGGLRTENWRNMLTCPKPASTFDNASSSITEPATAPSMTLQQPSNNHSPEATTTDTVSAYAALRTSTLEWMNAQHGKQPGSPFKAANVIVDVVRGEGTAVGRPWPSMLALGEDAEKDIKEKCERVLGSLREWHDVGYSIALEDTE